MHEIKLICIKIFSIKFFRFRIVNSFSHVIFCHFRPFLKGQLSIGISFVNKYSILVLPLNQRETYVNKQIKSSIFGSHKPDLIF